MIKLRLKEQPTVPLEAEVLSPDALARLSHADICSQTIYHGKRQCRVDDFFDVEGERVDQLEITGDLHRVRWLGRQMSRGTITVHGSVGMHLGAYMRGGSIDVHGNAGDWVGAEMTGGSIRVHGNTGGQVGAAYRGSLAGMRNGTIVISGTAGLEVGMRMRRGTIVAGGTVKDFAGLQMKGGTIVLLNGAEIRTGAWMNRGTIISLKEIELLPTFNYSCRYNPVILNSFAAHLRNLGVDLPYLDSDGAYDLYLGDSSVPGKGELLVWRPKA